jgi:hypothetical protein
MEYVAPTRWPDALLCEPALMRLRTRPLRAALCLLLTACHGDLGQDEGDFTDNGPLAACKVLGKLGEYSSDCGEATDFDLSDCEQEFFETPRSGFWNMQVRRELADGSIFYEMGNLSLGHDDRPAFVNRRQFSDTGTVTFRDREFLLVGHDDYGRRAGHVLAGCKARGADVIEGCFVFCNNGYRTRVGTFSARRIEEVTGEKAQRNLRLVSETRVAEGAAPDVDTLAPVTPVDVYVAKGHAYVVSLQAGLFVYDVRDAAHPTLTAWPTYWAGNDTDGWELVEGDSDLIGTNWNGVWAKGDALYVATYSEGVRLFDIRDAAHPRFVRDLSPNPVGCSKRECQTEVHTVFVDGDLLYAMKVNAPSEVLVYDVHEPLSPVLVNRFSTTQGVTRSSFIHDAFAFEGRLYANYWDAGLVVADASNVSGGLTELGRYSYPQAQSHASAVGRIKDRVIAFEGGEQWGAHLRVLDVTDPANIRRIGEYKLAPHVSIHNLQLQGERLYIAYYQRGVRVLDVSNPEDPQEVGSFATWRESDTANGSSPYEGAIGIRVPGDGFIYAIDRARGLLILQEE